MTLIILKLFESMWMYKDDSPTILSLELVAVTSLTKLVLVSSPSCEANWALMHE